MSSSCRLVAPLPGLERIFTQPTPNPRTGKRIVNGETVEEGKAPMMFWSDHDMGGWGYAGMAIGMVLFWVLVIVGIIALIRYTTGGSPTHTILAPPPHNDYETPERLLAARFARGEIDEAEYRHRLEVLRTTPRN
jgi:putative membrane protein